MLGKLNSPRNKAHHSTRGFNGCHFLTFEFRDTLKKQCAPQAVSRCSKALSRIAILTCSYRHSSLPWTSIETCLPQLCAFFPPLLALPYTCPLWHARTEKKKKTNVSGSLQLGWDRRNNSRTRNIHIKGKTVDSCLSPIFLCSSRVSFLCSTATLRAYTKLRSHVLVLLTSHAIFLVSKNCVTNQLYSVAEITTFPVRTFANNRKSPQLSLEKLLSNMYGVTLTWKLLEWLDNKKSLSFEIGLIFHQT